MKACAFFGHRDGLYEDKRQIIKEIVRDLIEKEGVNQFYIGGRGAFDSICADIVHGLKKDFPWIKSTLVLSYIPQKDFVLSNKYDDSVYLLEKAVLPKFAIWETNKALIDKCDFVVLAVWKGSGGAYRAAQYAKGKGKTTLNIYE
jgi:hypothetical protein